MKKTFLKIISVSFFLLLFTNVNSQVYIGMTMKQIQSEISTKNNWSIEDIDNNRNDEYGSSCSIKTTDTYFICFFEKNKDVNSRICVRYAFSASSGEDATGVVEIFNKMFLKISEFGWVTEQKGMIIDIYMKMIDGRYVFVYNLRS